MLFLLTNRTRAGLRSDDYQRLAALTAHFYSSIPEGCRFLGEYNALDWSRNVAILEAPSAEAVAELMRPFADYVDIEVLPIQPTEYWAKQAR